jgi:hypothetical protein
MAFLQLAGCFSTKYLYYHVNHQVSLSSPESCAELVEIVARLYFLFRFHLPLQWPLPIMRIPTYLDRPLTNLYKAYPTNSGQALTTHRLR